jgi:hypothetical protein
MTSNTARFRAILFLIVCITLILGGVWSVMAQDGLVPLPGMSGSSRAFMPVQQLNASNGDNGDRLGWDVALDGNVILAGSPYTMTGQAYIFERDAGGTWAEVIHFAGDDSADGDNFGIRLALQGDTAVVGAPGHDTDELQDGAAYVFMRSEVGTWTQWQKLILPFSVADAEFGRAVDIDGDRLIVAAPGVNTAYVYQRDGAQVWQYETDLNVGSPISDVAIDGERLLIGTSRDSDVGAAFLYQFEAGSWAFKKKLIADDGQEDDYFGIGVALQGSQAFVSAYMGNLTDAYSGAVYVFSEDGGDWTQTQKLTTNDAAPDDYFGTGLTVDGETMAIGSFGDSSAFGSVYLFGWNGTSWEQQDKIPAVGGEFGYAVDLQEGVLAVGAPDTNTFTGSVYVYNDPDLMPTATPTLTETPTDTPDPETPTVTPDPYIKLLVDGGFETDGADWIVKNSTGDKVKCNKEGKIIAYEGNCARRFKGSIGENSKIQQVITGATSSELTLSGYVNASGTVDSQVKVVVKYPNSTVKDKIIVDVTSETGGVYVPLSNFQPVLSMPVGGPLLDKIKVQVKNRSTVGTIYYDEMSLLSLN